MVNARPPSEYPSSNGRPGRYVRQLTGYLAFIPAPLPPDPPLEMTGTMQRLLSEADRALGRLEGSVQTLPNSDLFVYMYVRKEAVLSSQIEGTQSSLQDLLAAEAHALGEGRPGDVAEVVNYVAAMNYGLARLADLPISIRLFREIHALLLRGVRGSRLTPGELRTTQNWIGPGGCTLAEATFVPPPPTEVLNALGALESFLHREDELPLLVKIGMAHYQFETIHPFLDGNGRIGRLLITFLLCERGVLPKPVLYLSHYFKRHRQDYYDRLQSVRDEGDFESWMEFFLRGVAEVSVEAADTARKILELREEDRRRINDRLGRASGNGHRVLEQLYEQPIISVGNVQELLGTTFAGANQIVQRLVDLGILTEITGRARNRRFRYDAYVRLFEEGTET
ncbi:MAG: Fic family protein [Actinomycetota bacterium]